MPIVLAHHSVECLWGPLHSCNVTQISGANFLIGSQDRHPFQGTGKMKALVNFQSLSFNTSGENFLIWKQRDREILKGFNSTTSSNPPPPRDPLGTRLVKEPCAPYRNGGIRSILTPSQGPQQMTFLKLQKVARVRLTG